MYGIFALQIPCWALKPPRPKMDPGHFSVAHFWAFQCGAWLGTFIIVFHKINGHIVNDDRSVDASVAERRRPRWIASENSVLWHSRRLFQYKEKIEGWRTGALGNKPSPSPPAGSMGNTTLIKRPIRKVQT